MSEHNSKIFITIIIPCYNHEAYIIRALNSVMEQDYKEKKICVINDGSTDNSLSFIKSSIPDHIEITEDHIEGIYKGVSITLLNNKSPTGPSAARNKGIQLTWEETDAFMMLDADDLYLPGKISKSVQKLKYDIDNIGIVYTDAIINNINTGTNIHEFREPYYRDRLERECIISNTPLINKKALDKCGLYDKTFRTAEDWELWLRLTKLFVAVHIPEPLHVYTVTGQNASDVIDTAIWQKNWQRIQEKININL